MTTGERTLENVMHYKISYNFSKGSKMIGELPHYQQTTQMDKRIDDDSLVFISIPKKL